MNLKLFIKIRRFKGLKYYVLKDLNFTFLVKNYEKYSHVQQKTVKVIHDIFCL